MQLQECLAEACREGRSRLGNSALGSCKFCSKSGQEIVLSLLWCQNRYWRKYAECVCGQEDNILSCRCRRNRANDVLNVVDRIRYTSILGYALIIEVNFAFCINSNVLKQSVTSDRIVDIRLRLFVQVDNFCIAAALEVEYSVVVPAVLVITDQKTFRVCGKCCFSCSGVHHGEDTFLHLSAVPCVDDNLLTACDVEYYCCLRVQTQLFVILNFCFGCVVYNEIWLEVLKLFCCRFDEHVSYEMCLPSYLNDEADSHTGIFICTAECIYNEQSFVGELFFCDLFYCCPCFLGCRMVIVFVLIGSPPYSIFRILVHNDVFVFR